MSESPKRLACDPLWPGADRGADAAARRGEGRQVPLLFGALPHALLHRSRLVPGADGAQARTQGVAMMLLRHVRPSDCDRVLAVIDEWWGGPATSSHLPHVFFSHLAPTSFVLEANDGELVGFLLGFFSQAHPDEACVHMVGVHPAFRRLGFGRRLCERFFLSAQMHGRRWVRSVSTSSGPAIAFHRALGFVPLSGDAVIDGLPVTVRRDYAGPGGQQVVYRRGIVHDAPAAEAGRRQSASLSPARSGPASGGLGVPS